MVTILVAATGKLELPKINSQEQLVTALNRLAILREEQVLLEDFMLGMGCRIAAGTQAKFQVYGRSICHACQSTRAQHATRVCAQQQVAGACSAWTLATRTALGCAIAVGAHGA